MNVEHSTPNIERRMKRKREAKDVSSLHWEREANHERSKTMRRKTIIAAGSIALFLLCSVVLASGVWAQNAIGEPGRESGKPNPLNNV